MISTNTPAAVAALLRTRSTADLIHHLIETGKMIESGFPDSDIFEIRGWLLDELARRNLEAYDAWLESAEWPEDSDLFAFFLGEDVPF